MATDEKARFLELTRMKYADQAKWFLNGFWNEGGSDNSEQVWKFAQKFMELDQQKKKEGNELDEFWAHKFLESLGETLTVIQLRDTLRKVDLDANGKMALLEYLLFRYNKTVKACVTAPQGDNTGQIQEASDKLQAVQDALTELQKQLEEQKAKEAESKRLLAAAASALEKQTATAKAAADALTSQKAAEEAVRKSEAELRAALDDLKAQEDAYHGQIKELERKSTDSSASTVAKNKAANELAQLKGENPLPLRKAKITQEAAVRKVEKERKAQEAATEAALKSATAAQDAAEAAKRAQDEAAQAHAAAEQQARAVEAAVNDMNERYREAQEYLEEVKRKGGVAYGAIWWMEREMKEMQKYLPQKKQQK